MNELQISLIAAICMAVGFIVGAFTGWDVGRNRARLLIGFMANKMEQIRLKSRIKAAKKEAYFSTGNVSEAQDLEDELRAESSVFMHIQKSISEWCVANNEKDPFAL